MRTATIFSAALILVAGVAANAAPIVPTSEFMGDMFEPFEAIAPPSSLPGPVDIMEGEGTINDLLANIYVSALSLYSALTDTSIYPYGGNLMAGFPTGWGVVTFDSPVQQFGGFFGTADIVSGGTATFFDATNAQISSVALNIGAPGEWTWNGWDSTVPVSRVEFRVHSTPGKPMVMDNFRANVVPEPASLSLIALGALAITRRSR